MRIASLLLSALMVVPSVAAARQVLIRRVVTPPPTTFAGIQELKGDPPTGPCEFPLPSLDPATLTTVALADTGTLRLPAGWSLAPRPPGDDEFGETWLTGPDGNRALIRRRRNGSQGRRFLMYRNEERAVGTTCLLDRAPAGAIWSFYVPDPGDPAARRPFLAFGEIMTPAGRWYGVVIYSVSTEERARAAAVITAVALLP